MKKQDELKDITGAPTAGAPSTLVLTLPPNRRYAHVEIVATIAAAFATSAAELGDVRFLLGPSGAAVVQRVSTLQEMDDYQSVIDARRFGIQGNGAPGARSQSHYAFAQWDKKQYVTAEREALDVPRGWDAQIEIDCKDSNNAKAIAFRGYSEPLDSIPDDRDKNGQFLYRNWDNNGRPLIEKWYRTGKNCNDTNVDIDDLPRKGVWRWLDLYDPTGATITAVEIVKDSELIFKRTKTEQDIDLKRMDMFPQAGRFTIVPGMTDNPLDDWNLNGSNEFRIKVTLSAVPAAGSTIKVCRRVWGVPD